MIGDEPRATVAFAVTGAGLAEVSWADALAFAASVRRLAREDDVDEQQLALTLETAVALGFETIPIEPATLIFREALDLTVAYAGETASAGLLELQRLLAS
jgi:hypothetical protein